MSGRQAFSGKVVWITGASSGIGEALAIAFSQQGATVVLSARRREQLERVKAMLAEPERHMIAPLDLTDSDSLPGIVEEVLGTCGKVDILVNNGGISQRSHVRDTALAVDRRVMEVNFFGAITLTKLLLPTFRAAGGGQLVVISSLVGELPTPLRSAYCASKHALHGWFEALRAEEHEHGLRLLMVMPGFIRTEVSVNAITADGGQHGQMDDYQQQGMAPEQCAQRIIRAVQRGREQVIIGGRETAGIYLKRWFPSLYRQVIRRVRVT
ncbi:SDR family oxidoreductase [Alcanivorax quisquiliarum]|uniref:SDR family oxidoreductase n=1 Tax=Alcanivorax quisquiliarum TaxID=2933565 RepID=A0ABT0E396_9GAMM|nr:SDR family oxidoreductase [Alcanivorax quisquiliarum]MCK0536276.1 SDR family oxidoreductase [Alcanivorax quisquiliarum]